MNFFLKLLHRHRWETVSSVLGTATLHNLLHGTYTEKALCKIERCSVCGDVRGLIVSSESSQEVDPDYLIAVSHGQLHR